MSTATQPSGAPARRRLLALLVIAYALSFVDQTVVSTIGQAVKSDLRISDTQLGLLGGLYFALLYTLIGIPLARIADRFSRTDVITGAIAVWSVFTALCGVAGSFAVLGAFRFGVGVGEAGLTPPAHSLISDYFPPRDRTLALSIYNLGIPLGIMVGAIAGGWLTQAFSWRVAFVVVGLPGALVALAFKLLVKEPPRRSVEAPSRPVLSLASELQDIRTTVATLFGKWPVVCMVFGLTIAAFGAYGSGTFIPLHFIRTFGLNFTQVGLVYGLIFGVAPAIGTFGGGYLANRLGGRNGAWYALVPALGLLSGGPLFVWAFTLGSWPATAAAMFLPLVLIGIYVAPTFGVVQNMFDSHHRATASAILLFIVNLIALGGGPPLTGWVVDRFAAYGFESPAAHSVWASLGSLVAGHAPDFQRTCPGGLAPAGALASVNAQCEAALALATRHGIMVALSFYVWGGVAYLLASFGLARAVGRSGGAQG
jgi:predicted MFS family arabinose efflux permease